MFKDSGGGGNDCNVLDAYVTCDNDAANRKTPLGGLMGGNPIKKKTLE